MEKACAIGNVIPGGVQWDALRSHALKAVFVWGDLGGNGAVP